MRYRTLGRTGLRVGELGFGAWGIGKDLWDRTDDRESIAALKRALELGVDFFDTAYAYGGGHSENLIGFALFETKRRATVATKIPPKEWDGRPSISRAFPPDWIVRCTEASLRNLGTETIDLQQFHHWDDRWLEEPGWDRAWSAVERLKRDGKIRYWGASLASRRPGSGLELARSGLADAVQVEFNLFEQEPADELLGLCRRQGVGVIARSPLDRGGLGGRLTGRTRFGIGDSRRDYFARGRLAQTLRRGEAIRDILVPSQAADLAAAAIKFCLSFPEVSVVIPGMRRRAHVEANARAADGRYLSASVLERLRAHAWRARAAP